VDKVFDDRGGDHNNRLWTKPVMEHFAQFLVEGHVGVIKHSGEDLFYYNTETGEEFKSVPVQAPPSSSTSWKNFYHSSDYNNFEVWYPFNYHDFIKYEDPSEDNLPVSIPWYMEGWVKYPEGEAISIGFGCLFIGGQSGTRHIGLTMLRLCGLSEPPVWLSSSSS
jgi:hypothetical protein